MGGGGGGNGGRLANPETEAEPEGLDADGGIRTEFTFADAASGRAACGGTPLAADALTAPDAAIAALRVRDAVLGTPRAVGNGGSLAPLPASAPN